MEINEAAVIRNISDCLDRGASKRKSPMHTPVVGTSDGDLRVMVLREYDTDTRTLRFHTDVRSPKVAAILTDPTMHVLAYDPEEKIQLRIRGAGRVEQDSDLAEKAWQSSTSFAKRCYLAESAPSSQFENPTSGLPKWAEGITPTDQQVEPGRENFAVVLIKVTECDWLYLANDGHRRAKVSFDSEGDTKVSWLIP